MLKTENIHLLCPPSGRRDTLVAALEELHRTNQAGQEVRIVEVGTSRDLRPSACLADGWATRAFAWYCAQVNGRVISIDPEPHANDVARTIVGEFRPWLVQQRMLAQDFLGGFKPRIDLLYMDGPHTDDHIHSAEVHLLIYRALLQRPRFVLFDDIANSTTWEVKGELAIPAMLEDGFELVFARQHQAFLRWRD